MAVERVLTKPTASRMMLLFSMIGIALLVGALIAAAVLLSSAMSREIAEQQLLREADGERIGILELQLDEETGLRGFQLSRDANFLRPLREGRTRLPILMNRLQAQLQQVDPAALGALQAERSINGLWLTQIMEPALRSGGASPFTSLSAGKRLVDRYRDENARIETSLAQVGRDFDVHSSAFVLGVTRWTLGLVIVVALAFLYYLWLQTRLLRDVDTHVAAFERERTISRSLQKAFLFETMPSTPTLTFDALYRPADIEGYVGGDWYGVMKLPDGRFFFTVGDVAGHGIPAAVTMARTRQTILAASVHEADPALALARANDVVRLRGDFFITAICGFVDIKHGTFTYASAGHVPPLVVSSSGVGTYLPTRGIPLGFLDDLRCVSVKRSIEPGSMLVLYTDGLIEFDRDILRGQQRLAESAAAVLHETSERRTAALIERTFQHKRQLDDVAVLVIGFNAAPVLATQEIALS